MGQTLASADVAAENADTGMVTPDDTDTATIDPETGEITDTPEDELESDFVLDEAARVLGDLIELMRQGAAVS